MKNGLPISIYLLISISFMHWNPIAIHIFKNMKEEKKPSQRVIFFFLIFANKINKLIKFFNFFYKEL